MSWEDFDWTTLGENWEAWKDLARQAGDRQEIDNPLGWVRYLSSQYKHPRDAELPWYVEGSEKPPEAPAPSDDWKDPRSKRGVIADYQERSEKDGPQTEKARKFWTKTYWDRIGKERPR